jgi:quercetin 2,3-dioxygenase
VSAVRTFQIRRGADRARTRTEWLDSRHSFAFGSHYDPDNTGFGLLLANNSDVLQPGPGYPVHAHRDIEILSWVVAGSLVHQEYGGTATVIQAGQLHHLSAGSGLRHTEFSAGDQPVRVVQMWLAPDEFGQPPASGLLRSGDRLAGGKLVEIATAAGEPATLRIRQRAAALSVARLPAGAAVTLPAARYVHVFLTAGSVTFEPDGGETDGGETGDGETDDGGETGGGGGGGALVAGDALRITDGDGGLVRAGEPAELLVWRMHAGIEAAAGPSTYPG